VIIQFDIPSPVDVQTLNIFVRALCAYDCLYLRRNPNTPAMFASGVVYRTQPVGLERFLPIPGVLAAGSGDCDQLASWRAAELRERYGIKALPEVVQMSQHLYHVFVRYPDGMAEDISAHLGMQVPQKLIDAAKRKLSHETERRSARISGLLRLRRLRREQGFRPRH
jgi:hypothetical protein